MSQYQAIDGSIVEIPPVKPLPDKRLLTQGQNAADRVAVLIGRPGAERERWQDELARLRHLDKDSPEFRAQGKAMQARAKQLLAEADALQQKRATELGPNGANFLKMLTASKVRGEFWQAVQLLAGSRRCLTLGIDSPRHEALVTLLMGLSPAERIPILAKRFWPEAKPKQRDILQGLVQTYLSEPYADLRHFETGTIHVPDLDALSRETHEALAQRNSGFLNSLSAFKTNVSQSRPDASTQGSDLRRLRALIRSPVTDLSDEELRVLIGGPDAAKTHLEGVTRSEINLAKYNTMLSVHRKGGTEFGWGVILISALCSLPAGDWTRFRFDAFDRDFVWPYLAERFGVLDRAFGLAPAMPFEPQLEPRKAIAMLALLPKTPVLYADVLEAHARKGKGTLAIMARTFLER